jgi:hypothetical protein
MAAERGNDLQAQRRRAVKAAWVLAAVAVAIFAAFILSGVLKA